MSQEYIAAVNNGINTPEQIEELKNAFARPIESKPDLFIEIRIKKIKEIMSSMIFEINSGLLTEEEAKIRIGTLVKLIDHLGLNDNPEVQELLLGLESAFKRKFGYSFSSQLGSVNKEETDLTAKEAEDMTVFLFSNKVEKDKKTRQVALDAFARLERAARDSNQYAKTQEELAALALKQKINPSL
jgi:hypothetical protein